MCESVPIRGLEKQVTTVLP